MEFGEVISPMSMSGLPSRVGSSTETEGTDENGRDADVSVSGNADGKTSCRGTSLTLLSEVHYPATAITTTNNHHSPTT